MYQVAIIGAGQLGSRHLQGLKLASTPLSITVLDNSEESLKIARERYESVVAIGEKDVQFVKKIDDLPGALDLVIIATGANPRAAIVKSLLAHSTVRYMILEKVLFIKLSDYEEISALLNEKDVICWVNCPRRMFGSYSIIKDRLNYSKPIIMEYVGKDWGLCCNSMHFIDVFLYLTQEENYSICSDDIENRIYESKRPGYIEMNGVLHIKTEKGNALTLSSLVNGTQQGRVEIKNGLDYFALDEVAGILTLDGKTVKVDTPYQSQTTGILADEILRTGFCPLSSYNLSAKYHKVYIENMLERYNIITGENSDILPIT